MKTKIVLTHIYIKMSSRILYDWSNCFEKQMGVDAYIIRPGKLDLLFLISNFHDLGAGRRSLLIIHYRFLEVWLPETQEADVKYLIQQSFERVWLQLRPIMNVEAGG